MQYRSSLVRAGAAVAALLAVAACASEPVTSSRAAAANQATNTFVSSGGTIKVCKASELAGQFNVVLNKTGGGDGVYPMPSSVTQSILVDGGSGCTDVFFQDNPSSWTTLATLTATEEVPSNMAVASIWVFRTGQDPVQYTGTNSASVSFGFYDNASIEFYNVKRASGEGCTPGYWKVDKHAAAWGPTGYTSGQRVGSVFANSSLYGLNNYTLLQSLSFKGGSDNVGAAGILFRAATAAILNAGHPAIDYYLTAAQIVAQVNAALATNDRQTILLLATELDTANNAGCEL